MQEQLIIKTKTIETRIQESMLASEQTANDEKISHW